LKTSSCNIFKIERRVYKMAKKINPSNINKGYSRFNEKTITRITDRFGEEYDVTISKYFKKTDIAKLLIDFSSVKDQLKEKVDNTSLLNDFTYIYPILLIKYFTNIIVPDIAVDMIQLSTQLIDLEIMDKIMNCLSQEEIDRVSVYMKQATDNLPKTLGDLGFNNNDITNAEVI